MGKLSEAVTFKGGLGHRLAARLDLPAGAPPRAYALFAHCFSCSKDVLAAKRIAEALTHHGIAVLRFDFTGLGQSEGDFANTNFSSNVEDLVAAADFLRRHHQAPRLLVGHSLGGSAVLMAAPRVPEAVAVATIGAPADPLHVAKHFEQHIREIDTTGEAEVKLGGRPFRIKKQFLEDIRNQKVLEIVRDMKKALLVMHAPRDEYVGIENASKIFTAARHPKSFLSLDRADHLLRNKEDALYAGTMLQAWASHYLGEVGVRAVHVPVAEKEAVIVQETGEGPYANWVVAGGHVMRADEPVALGGSDSGPSPYEYLSAALGACTSITLRMYADLKNFPVERITVTLRHEKKHAEDCEGCTGKIDHITRQIRIEGPLEAAQLKRLQDIADKCPVHKTLNGPVMVTTSVET